VPIGKAKPRLCDLVQQAKQGQTLVITVHDEPVAQIGPVQSKAGKLTEEWRRRRKGIRLNRTGQRKLSISQLIQEGRK